MERVATHGNEAVMTEYYGIAYKTKEDPEYYDIMKKLHFSKERIRPFFTAWAVQKNSTMLNQLNGHILRLDQVILS